MFLPFEQQKCKPFMISFKSLLSYAVQRYMNIEDGRLKTFKWTLFLKIYVTKSQSCGMYGCPAAFHITKDWSVWNGVQTTLSSVFVLCLRIGGGKVWISRKKWDSGHKLSRNGSFHLELYLFCLAL